MFCVLIAHTTVVCIIWNKRSGIDMHLNTTSITLFYIGLFIYYPYKRTLLVTESDTIIDVHTIRLDCELNIMDSTSYCFISIECCILLALIILEMKIVLIIFLHISRETLYYKNYNYLNTWRTYQRAKIYLLQYYLND